LPEGYRKTGYLWEMFQEEVSKLGDMLGLTVNTNSSVSPRKLFRILRSFLVVPCFNGEVVHSRCFSCIWKSGKKTPRAAFAAFDPAVVGGVARTASRVAELGINESSRTDRNLYRNSLNLGLIDLSNTSVPLYGALVEGACCVLFVFRLPMHFTVWDRDVPSWLLYALFEWTRSADCLVSVT